jgi:broad specificity phosphatase PhoE
VAQAEAAAEALRDTPIEHVFTSELPRTRQTGEIVNRHHGAPVTAHPGINDIRSGFEGRPVAEYQAAIAADPLHIRPPGGESLTEHARRVTAFLEEIEARPERTVLVVAHEETLRVVAGRYRGMPLAETVGLAFANCEVLRFTPPPGPVPTRPADVAQAFVSALAAADFREARRHLADGAFSYLGPVRSFSDADEFIAHISRIGTILKSIEQRHRFAQGDTACLICDVVTTLPDLEHTRVAMLFTLRGRLITRLEMFYDAHPYAQMFQDHPPQGSLQP